jgi:hypothetical protein
MTPGSEAELGLADEAVFTKIRWFVVVEEGRGSCTCV